MQKRNLRRSGSPRLRLVANPNRRIQARRRLGLAVLAICGLVLILGITQLRQNTGIAIAPEPFGPPASPQRLLPFTMGQLDSALSARLTVLAQQPKLKAGIFALDLTSGSYVVRGDQDAYPAASTIKLPILLALLQDIDRGMVQWNEVLTMTAALKVSGSGFLQYKPLGTKLRVWDVAGLMITDSDNTATQMLIQRLGGMARLNERFAWWGLTQTAVRAPLPDIAGLNTTSPQDLAVTLTLIDQGAGLTPRTRDRALDLMRRVENRSLLPTGLAKVEPTARIAHKTGTIGIALADAGLIDLPNGKHYLLAVMVERPREDSRATKLIQDISSQVANLWSSAPGSPLR